MKTSLILIFMFFSLFFCYLLISFENMVYSVFSLILVFFNVFGIFLCLGVAEFLAVVILIVYIGAVAILFLFTVMMLGTRNFVTSYELHTSIFSRVFRNPLVWIFIVFGFFKFSQEVSGNTKEIGTGVLKWFNDDSLFFDLFMKSTDFQDLVCFYSNDIFIFGHLLYTEYCFLF